MKAEPGYLGTKASSHIAQGSDPASVSPHVRMESKAGVRCPGGSQGTKEDMTQLAALVSGRCRAASPPPRPQRFTQAWPAKGEACSPEAGGLPP